MTPSLPDDSGHPSGFDFNYGYWFGCECGQRNSVSSASYMSAMCSGDDDTPVCTCGTPIDIGDPTRILLRDLEDIDCVSTVVDQHFWYHSSIYGDWPSSASYVRDLRNDCDSVEEWDSEFRDRTFRAKSSLALHLGTYAAAVENMMRRMVSQPTPGRGYWLHQVQIRLSPGDLHGEIGDESWSSFGDVPGPALDQLDARAARYVNNHEASGSISLAIHPGAVTSIITKVRSIRLPVAAAEAAVLPAGQRATTNALAELEAAEALRPDTAGIPADQLFANPVELHIKKMRGGVDDQVIAVNEQLHRYHDRRREIWTSLRNELIAAYLAGVNPWVRRQFTDALETMRPTANDPDSYHHRFRLMAGLVTQPQAIVRQFEKAPWRTPEPPS